MVDPGVPPQLVIQCPALTPQCRKKTGVMAAIEGNKRKGRERKGREARQSNGRKGRKRLYLC